MTSTAQPDAASAQSGHRITVRCQFCDTWNRVVAERASDRPKCGKCGKPMLHRSPDRAQRRDVRAHDHRERNPGLVDFYADWCGPCKIMAPSVDQLAAENQGKLLVAKLDTDRAPKTAQSFNIRSIPTTILFRAGKEANRLTGAAPLKALKQLAGV